MTCFILLVIAVATTACWIRAAIVGNKAKQQVKDMRAQPVYRIAHHKTLECEQLKAHSKNLSDKLARTNANPSNQKAQEPSAPRRRKKRKASHR